MNQKTDNKDDAAEQPERPEGPVTEASDPRPADSTSDAGERLVGDDGLPERSDAATRDDKLSGDIPSGDDSPDHRISDDDRVAGGYPDEPLPQVDSELEPPRPRRTLSAFVAWLALLFAAAALVGVAFLAWQSRGSDADAVDTEAAIAALSDNLDQVRRSVQELQSGFGDLSELGESGEQIARQNADQLASLQRELSEIQRQNESVVPRLANLENSLSMLQGVSAGVRDTWVLAETEYYMQIANAQLQLAGNPQVAAHALRFADERIRQLADPALGEVRRALTQELQDLEAMDRTDVEGLTMALASLADRVASLPLNDEIDVPGREPGPVDPELSGFDRAVASMKQAFGDVISVRRTDEALTPLMSPDAAHFLRANLELQFQTARLALLKGEQATFRQSLEDAATWLERYYDADSRPVQGALQTIGELQNENIAVRAPDISGSLRLLRQYRTLREANPTGDDGNMSGDAVEPRR